MTKNINYPARTDLSLTPKQQEAKVQIAEAIRQDGILFNDHIKQFMDERGCVKNIPLKDMMDNFERSPAYHQLSSHYQKQVPSPNICAAYEGHIKISREGNSCNQYKQLTPKSKLVLRPYQQDIVETTGSAKGSVLIEAPTGSGKTVIAKHIIADEIAKGGIVLIVAPKLNLLQQLKDTFDDMEAQVIHGSKKYNDQHNVFVSTLQTAHGRKLGFKPTMIIIDEIHFGFTGKMIKQLLADFNGRLVGLSATPYTKQGTPLQGFDLHINRYDLNYMITNNYLVHISTYAPVKVDLKGVKVTAGDYNIKDLDGKLNNLHNIMQVVNITKDKILERTKTLVFCINIQHAVAVAEAYTLNGVSTGVLHSKMDKDAQNAVMEQFKHGELKALANVDMLTTGYDHPPTDTLVFARPTKSQNLYKQMVGRALRLSEGKTRAVLIDCAGVVEELGMPTDPIKPKEVLEIGGAMCCKECESTKIYQTTLVGITYYVCAECANKWKPKPSGVECEDCNRIYGQDAPLSTVDDKLLLNCECGHVTLISATSTDEELKEIFDDSTIRILKMNAAKIYTTHVIDKIGMRGLTSPYITRQIQALDVFISRHPEDAADIKLNHSTMSIFSKEEIDHLLDIKPTEDGMAKVPKRDIGKYGKQPEYDSTHKSMYKVVIGNEIKDDVFNIVWEYMKGSSVLTPNHMQRAVKTRAHNILAKQGKSANAETLCEFIDYIESQAA